MADFNALEALINANIKKNGVQAITGNILNGILRGMVSALGKGYTIAGSVTPSSDPGTMTGPVAYIAYTAGTYTHFGGLEVGQGEVSMLIYNEAEWHKEVLYSLAATATVDGNVGTPEVGVSFVDGLLTFDFRNMKGEPGVNGQDGEAAGFGAVTASVDASVGTPSVTVSSSGPNTAKSFAFSFHNLKGEQGVQGIQGIQGPQGVQGEQGVQGPVGVESCVVTVDNTSGTPSCSVSLVGQVLHLDFTGLKGLQGDTGSSVDYPFTIVNNLTTDDATQALSAAMGVELAGQVSQLEAKLPMLGGYLVPLLRKVVYKDDDAESLIAGINALLNTVEVTSISAVYTQPGTIYAGQPLDDLKANLVVTANYNDGSSVEVSTYELSGTLTAGTSSILVTYQEFTTTFNVTVTDAVHYRDGSYIPGGVALRNAATSSNLSQCYTYDGVKYVFTNGSSTTAAKRCSYYLFDLLLTAGKQYKFTVEFNSAPSSSQTFDIGIGYYDETYRQAGVANVYQACDYSSHLNDSGWQTTTKSGNTITMSFITPEGCVGGRLTMRYKSSGTESNWPSSITVKRLIIQEVTE